MSANDQLQIKQILPTQMKDVSKLDIAFRILMGHHLGECLTTMRKKAFKTLRSDHSQIMYVNVFMKLQFFVVNYAQHPIWNHQHLMKCTDVLMIVVDVVQLE